MLSQDVTSGVTSGVTAVSLLFRNQMISLAVFAPDHNFSCLSLSNEFIESETHIGPARLFLGDLPPILVPRF